MKLNYLLAGALAASAICASAYESKVEERAYFSTNKGALVGKNATMKIDGSMAGWTEDMIVATNGANAVPTAFKGSHENCVLDIYAVYAAWDDANLYLAWQMCNTGDTWARTGGGPGHGDGPLTDYGHIGNVPLIVALSVDPSKPGMTGLLEDGHCVWRDQKGNGTTFDPSQVHVDHMLFFSAQPGQGVPAIFTPVNASGATNYGAGCKEFSKAGVKYELSHEFQPSHLWRMRSTAQYNASGELVSDPSVADDIFDATKYDNLKAGPVAGLNPHDPIYDSFFEMSIPLSAIGISRSWLESNGIGVRVIATRGESAIDCCPWDPAMFDNVFKSYGKDASTTGEKDDLDVITYKMADVAKIRDLGSITPPEPVDPIVPDPIDPVPGDDDYDTPDSDYVVYLQDSPWDAPNCYVWDKGDGDRQYAGTWPGSPMHKVRINGKEYFKYTFAATEPLKKPMCIFNGNGQTADLELVNHGIYTTSGYTGNNIVKDPTAVEIATAPEAGETLYFNLQGHRLQSAPEKGIFIRVTNGKALKVAK